MECVESPDINLSASVASEQFVIEIHAHFWNVQFACYHHRSYQISSPVFTSEIITHYIKNIFKVFVCPKVSDANNLSEKEELRIISDFSKRDLRTGQYDYLAKILQHE